VLDGSAAGLSTVIDFRGSDEDYLAVAASTKLAEARLSRSPSIRER